MSVEVETNEHVFTVILSRPEVRNAVDRDTAEELADAFRRFEADEHARVAVLWGAGGDFCAGADLKAIAAGRVNRMEEEGDGPMGPSRMALSKPCIAAIEGHAVAGGLELALWCDMRVAARSTTLGVYCRRWGVPLIDGGTARLPRIVGLGRAMDMILTGRPVRAEEAHAIGLVDRVVPDGQTRSAAETLAAEIARFPQACMISDRASVYGGLDRPLEQALAQEFAHGRGVLPEAVSGAARFAGGAGRHGELE